MSHVGWGLLMATFAGLATGVGSAIAFFARRTNTRFLSVALGLSAGVMLYVSFVELYPLCRDAFAQGYGARTGGWLAAAAFFGGIALVGLIDRLVPSVENPHEPHRLEELAVGQERRTGRDRRAGPVEAPAAPAALAASAPLAGGDADEAEALKKRQLHRMGLMSALAIAVHNFPEGMATFAAAAQSPELGLPVALAVAIHNIPEGIAVSVPLYYATGSRKKAFWLSFLSGLAEPAGALIGWLLLSSLITPVGLGAVFGAVAGVMVFISLDELLPSAQKYGEHHAAVWGLVAGMAVMAASLLLF